MSKTITIRLGEKEYKQIAQAAESEHRPISNFIMHTVMEALSNLNQVDDEEMNEILSNPHLMQKLKRGHAQAVAGKGRFVE